MTIATPTFKQLEAFYWAASCVNFATAAERLHLTVSSLSKRLAELEQLLGQALFDRSGHRAVLTEAGHRLLPAALRVLDAVSDLQTGFARDDSLVGRCCFGVGELSALTWLPAFVARLRREHPLLQVEPCVDVGAVLERRLDQGELDFAVIAGRPARASLQAEPVGQARFVWVTAAAVAGTATLLTPELLQQLPLITLPTGAGTSRLLDDWLQTQPLDQVERLPCNNWIAVAGMLRLGLGVGFLPLGWAGVSSFSVQ